MMIILRRIRTALQCLDDYIAATLFRSHADGFALAGVAVNKTAGPHSETKSSFSIKDIVGDGFLWAVPRCRRTLERRLTRRFGLPDANKFNKMIVPKTTLRSCNVCGEDHEVGVLCPSCYKKVIDETKLMQEAIQNQLGLEPVEKEVVVLYSGEKDDKSKEFFESKRIVELPKERPSWFSKNLLQESTQQSSNAADVKPPSLG